MNTNAPVSTLMTTPVYTVDLKDKLLIVQDLFDFHNIHHIPVISEGKIVGIISKSDLLHFLKGATQNEYQKYMNTVRLKNYTAEEIMTIDIAVLKPSATINDALGVFKSNHFHAIPIAIEGKLKGILTTHDILMALYAEKEKV